MQIKGLLPIGSVVSLNNLEQVKVMITGFCVRKAGEEESLFDYSGCVHPVGIIRPDQMILFNHSSIDKIHYMGYLDICQGKSRNFYEFLDFYHEILCFFVIRAILLLTI